ncbi:hypothetical protein CCR80_02860 [Rhodothalassium salexigens]|uniref:hypothetical protein n=1 Tax=Rhodothalassium salexigens TaxID=1086 RepID=UPI001912C6BA|nr:hypothetical protein [Rhodothalassium salexigens]MBK5919979.1 hypothetical protein [Rhodothalassium salexigens]
MTVRSTLGLGLAATACLGLASAGASASTVTPDVIFGSGNANGAFTIGTGLNGGIELGLRGKLRFNDSNLPENTFNYDGVDTYSFDRGTPPTGFGFAANSPTTPVWNFEWSINTDVTGTTGLALDGLTYELRLDGDPTAGTDFTDSFDLINAAFNDHAIGTNATGNGGGTVASDSADYAALIAQNNVAQNSWNYEFFNDGPAALIQLASFDPQAIGTYTIQLEAFLNGDSVAATSIDIRTVPMPGALAFFGLGLGAAGVAGLRRARRAR